MLKEVKAFLSPIDLSKREYETLCEIMEGTLGEAIRTVDLKCLIAYLSSFLLFSLVTFNELHLDVTGNVKQLILVQNIISLTCFIVFLAFKCYRGVYVNALKSVQDYHSKSYTLGEECIVLECNEVAGSPLIKLVFRVVFRGCILVVVNLKEKKTIIEQKKVLRMIRPMTVYEDNEEL